MTIKPISWNSIQESRSGILQTTIRFYIKQLGHRGVFQGSCHHA